MLITNINFRTKAAQAVWHFWLWISHQQAGTDVRYLVITQNQPEMVIFEIADFFKIDVEAALWQCQ